MCALCSLPYEWRSPIPYFFTLIIQIVGCYVAIPIAAIFLCLFTGLCRFVEICIKDTENSFRELVLELSNLREPTPLLQRVFFKEKMRIILRFQADTREFSSFSIT